MRRILLLAALFVALGATTTSAQYNNRDREERRVINTEPGVYQDDRGEYQWQTVERRVWIPERRTSGIFGIGSRTIPGHYEMRTDRVKTYRNADRNDQYGTQRKGWEGKHPHGMPPGQRKKMQNRRDNDRYDDRDDRRDRDESRSKGKNRGRSDRDNN